MSLKLSDLPNLVDKRVVIEMQGLSDGTYEIEGMVCAVNSTGLVLAVKGDTIILQTVDIVDINEADAPRPIVRRKVRHIPARQARQHLLDRHGVPLDLIRGTSPKTAYVLHQATDHSNLGHMHEAPEEGDE